MPRLILILGISLAAILLNSCSFFKQSEDPNYSLCKTLGSKIQFGGTTTYQPEVADENSEKERLQATYQKLDCSQYQAIKF